MPARASSMTLTADSAEALRELGRALGAALVPGDVVALIGPLGAGKTTLTQGIAWGLGVAAERHVASPTFALVNEHPGRVSLVHADLYRLDDERELPELGLEEDCDQVVRVIEWADRFDAGWPATLSPQLLTVRLAFGAVRGAGSEEIRTNTRSVHLSGPLLDEPRLAWLLERRP